jgi:hypothetical protein
LTWPLPTPSSFRSANERNGRGREKASKRRHALADVAEVLHALAEGDERVAVDDERLPKSGPASQDKDLHQPDEEVVIAYAFGSRPLRHGEAHGSEVDAKRHGECLADCCA